MQCVPNQPLIKRREEFLRYTANDLDEVVRIFVENVLLVYLERLSARLGDSSQVTSREVGALLSGFQLGAGQTIPLGLLSRAIRERLGAIEFRDSNVRGLSRTLVAAQRSVDELLRYPIVVLRPVEPGASVAV